MDNITFLGVMIIFILYFYGEAAGELIMASDKINVGDYVVVKYLKYLKYPPTSLYIVTEISGSDMVMYYVYDKNNNMLYNNKVEYSGSVEHAPLDFYLLYLKAKQNAKV